MSGPTGGGPASPRAPAPAVAAALDAWGGAAATSMVAAVVVVPLLAGAAAVDLGRVPARADAP